MSSLACVLALTVASSFGGGAAPRGLEVTVQDDAQLLHGTIADIHRAARRIASLGADRVRVTAGWSAMAPSPRSARRPSFDATDPAAYPEDGWRRLDEAVKASSDNGLDVMIDVAFWAPRWAVRRGIPRSVRQRWAPDAREFGQFAEAVGRRYSGHYLDPAATGETLPAVRLWTTWNEPNHSSFLLPQWRRTRRGLRPASPHVYRGLHNAGYEALKRVSGENRVLIGGLASAGAPGRGERRSIDPLIFTRELACVNARLEPMRRGSCRGFEPLRADGFSHHPYSLSSAPAASNPDPDTVQLGDLDRLGTLLRQLHERGRIASELPLFLTEYGYESNPPDPLRGVSPEQQARNHGQATFLAWQRPDTAMFAQFLLNDIGPDTRAPASSAAHWRSYQTGLYFQDGSPKPAAQAFKLPFWIEARRVAGQELLIAFGQVRPGEGRQRVVIETRGEDGAWRQLESLETRSAADETCDTRAGEFLTDASGFYLRAAPYDGQLTYRPRWIRGDGGSEYGVPVSVGEPLPVEPPAAGGA